MESGGIWERRTFFFRSEEKVFELFELGHGVLRVGDGKEMGFYCVEWDEDTVGLLKLR